jgi:predicted nucleic acid-binding protein
MTLRISRAHISSKDAHAWRQDLVGGGPARVTLPVQAVIEHLAEACREEIHEFWPDEVSLLDSDVVDATRIHGPRQLTDIYLLALAVQHEGRLVTFDPGIALAAVRKATTHRLLIL